MVRPSIRRLTVFVSATVGCLLCVAWWVAADKPHLDEPVTYLLVAFALVSNLTAARWNSSLELSGSLLAALVAAAFVGPAAGFFVILVAESLAWGFERLRPVALPQNLLGLGAPVIGVGVGLASLFPDGAAHGAVFYLAFGVAAALASVANLAIVAAIHALHDGTAPSVYVKALRSLLLVWALNIALTVCVAAAYGTVGLSAAALLLVGLLAFTYQSHLVARAEERTRRHASLSWGVLSAMVRNIDMRDSRMARHSAAVAQFARDIAGAAGLPEADRELAHTAGLLHDVGKFALSDRVMEREGALTEDDWRGIRRHPELGADMLKDVGGYGPIADIVRAHHERLDGRGYPRGLTADEIPEVAKIVAVAEVYDTLTADDSYRAKMSSFEALRELRRIAGTQLDPRYVEALASALAGRDVDYRHAGAADFDRELQLERRIGEAVGAGQAGG
ncbi:MAG TPA: HD-GYP domain-containing protein [Thermoleophilaceae bacterium]|nr:HD-GYP domain-containing protein [Thermoleophilaceae bacterium]